MQNRVHLPGRSSLIWVFCLFLIGSIGCSRQSREPLAWDKDAEQKLLDGQYEEALALCNQQLRVVDNEWKAHVLRGRVFMLQSQFEEALTEFTKAKQLNPNDVDLKYRRADALRALGRTEESQEEHQQARVEDRNLEPSYSISPSVFYSVPIYVGPGVKNRTPREEDESEKSNASPAESTFASREPESEGDQNSQHSAGKGLSAVNQGDPQAPEAMHAPQDSPAEALGASYSQKRKARAKASARLSSTEESAAPLILSRPSNDKHSSSRFGSLATTEDKPKNDKKKSKQENEDPESEKDGVVEKKPKPVISSALPRNLEYLAPPGNSPRQTIPGLGQTTTPLSTGLQTKSYRGPLERDSAPSGINQSFQPPSIYGQPNTRLDSDPYTRINPVYSPHAKTLGGVGPAINYMPYKGLQGSTPGTSPKKAILSTSLPGTGLINPTAAKPGSVPLSTSLPGTGPVTSPTGKPGSYGSAIPLGTSPYRGVPTGNLNPAPQPKP